MARFHFRLERVLRVRAVLEEVARAEWQTAEHAAAQAEERHRSVVSDRRAAQNDLPVGPGPIDVNGLLWQQASIERMSEAAGRLRERARTVRYQADEARRPWEERRRDVRGLERLREHALLAHLASEETAEIAAMDEIAIARADARRRTAASSERP
jgi:flagellar export protein FliJ